MSDDYYYEGIVPTTATQEEIRRLIDEAVTAERERVIRAVDVTYDNIFRDTSAEEAFRKLLIALKEQK